MKLVARFCLLLGLLFSAAAAADIRIASWNIQNLGWGDNKSFSALTSVASQFDLIAIQELMDADALATLENSLEAATGEPWESMHSHAMGSSERYQEMYAFLWRDDAVSYERGAAVYIDDRNAFAREPYSAQFRAIESDTDFVLGTVHITYGKGISDRTPEIHALREYWDWLAEVYPESESRRILLGDFNLRPSHEAWAELFEVAQPLITTGATTLSSNDRQYANLYDNMIVPLGHDLPISEAGILEYPELLSGNGEYWTHEDARRHVSDHAPVYLTFGDAPLHDTSLGVELPAATTATEPVTVEESPADCVDLNTGSRDELMDIIHIGEVRVDDLVGYRPWTGVDQLTRISGIGPARLRDIKAQDLVCQ